MILRPDFTIDVYSGRVQYTSERFDILIEKKNLSEFEIDLLRWMFAGKKLFDVPGDKKIVYRFYERTLRLEDNSDSYYKHFYKSNITHVKINGENFPVIKNYIQKNYVILGKNPITIKASWGKPVGIRYDQNRLSIELDMLENIPDFIMEFIRSRDAKVLEKYLPLDEDLLIYVRTRKKKVRLTIRYTEKNIDTASLTYSDGVFEGIGVFRDGIAKLSIPVDYLAELKENFKFGFMPRQYVDEIIAEYPPLDHDVELYTIINNDNKSVTFYGKICCAKAWTDFKRAYVKVNGKKKRASLKSLKKYLKEIGLLE